MLHRGYLLICCLVLGSANADPGISNQEEILAAATISQALNKPRLIPRQEFLNTKGHSNIRTVELSYDGQYLIHEKTTGKISELWLTDTTSLESRHLFSIKGLRNLDWSINSQHILLTLDKGIARYTVESDQAPVLLIDMDWEQGAHYYGPSETLPDYFYIFNPDLTGQPGIYQVDLAGNQSLVFEAESGLVRDFLTTANQSSGGESISFVTLTSTSQRIIYQVNDQLPHKEILRCEFDDTCGLVAFDQEKQELILIARLEDNFLRLLAYNINNGNIREIHSDPAGTVDIAEVHRDRSSSELLIARYEGDFSINYGLNRNSQAHIQIINNKMGSGNSLLVSPRSDIKPWLIHENNPSRQQAHYFLYRPENKSITRLFQDEEKHERLSQQEMATVIPIHYTASDGMQLYGYLTLPRGASPSSSPLVVYPHGGPWTRVQGRFNVISQFLANRGYIVFEPNFRSSTGYGRHYVYSANKDFGQGRVQQDIIDGVEYLLTLGIGDRQSLAIYGQSFGGFSTLGALAFTPELFQVGIASAPPADLGQAMKRVLEKGEYFKHDPLGAYQVLSLLGDVNNKAEMERLYQQSPARHASNINKPLLVIAGKQDNRVHIDDVTAYVLNLQAMDKPVSFLMDKDEGHSYRQPLSRQAYLYLLEKMLGNALDTDYEPLENPELRRYIEKNLKLDHNQLLD